MSRSTSVSISADPTRSAVQSHGDGTDGARVATPATSARRRAIPVSRTGWTRGRIVTALLGWDLLGIGGAWIGACLSGWVPGLWALAAPVLGFLVAYIAGAFTLPPPERPWSATFAAGLGGVAAALTAGLAATGAGSLTAAALPVAVLALWPALARIVVARRVRARVAAARWLVIGSPEVLSAVEHERTTGHLLGDVEYLAAPGPGSPPPATVGMVADLDRFLARRWTGIVIAGAETIGEGAVRDLMLARVSGGVRVYDLTEFWERFLRKVPVLHLQAGWVALSGGFHLLHDPVSLRLKRLSDLGLAGVGLVLGTPVLLLTAILVKLSSRGPVLFRQERIGVDGELFTVLKFRTMRVGSEQTDRYTRQGDARITAIGGFLRRSRIDELPQLWNVLRGEMSFIGPRAEWSVLVADYQRLIPYYHLRHTIKPGLTGWAQVNYPYGASVEDAVEKLQYDLWYLKHHSLWLDLRILLRTVRVVLFGMGR